jgi:ATPase subunit of ABC transporter with duplicated ATPase domains
MWNCPDLFILDEPINYLDRESSGPLSEPVKKFDGGGVIVSHSADMKRVLDGTLIGSTMVPAAVSSTVLRPRVEFLL